jgi:hypothetical protein
MISGFGFRVSVSGFGFRVSGFGRCKAASEASGFKVCGSGFKFCGSGFRVQGEVGGALGTACVRMDVWMHVSDHVSIAVSRHTYAHIHTCCGARRKEHIMLHVVL